jgi:hypothetical protein
MMDELWDRIWPICILAAVVAVISWMGYATRQEYVKSLYAQQHGLRWMHHEMEGWERAQ